jgi:hypothetical protein
MALFNRSFLLAHIAKQHFEEYCELIIKQSKQLSSNHTQQRLDKRFLRPLLWQWANRLKIPIQCCFSYDFSNI